MRKDCKKVAAFQGKILQIPVNYVRIDPVAQLLRFLLYVFQAAERQAQTPTVSGCAGWQRDVNCAAAGDEAMAAG